MSRQVVVNKTLMYLLTSRPSNIHLLYIVVQWKLNN